MLLAGGDYYDGDDYSLKKLAIFADLAQSTKKQRRYDLRTTTTGRLVGKLETSRFGLLLSRPLDEPRTLTTLNETHLRRPGDFSSPTK